MRRSGLLAAFVCMALLLVDVVGTSEESEGASYPTRDVTLIVAWPPGGAADANARALAQATTPHLGKPMIVKNVVGGAGALGAAELARSKPDGYTVSYQTGATVTIAPHLQDVGFKSPDDFEILNMVNMQPYLWVTRANTPWKTLHDIAEEAKKRPGEITFTFSGVGTGGHLTMEHFTRKQGFKLKIVPFKSAAEGVMALLGGHVDTSMALPPDVIVHVQEGRLRALGAFSNFPGMERIPGLKSWKDQGIDYEMWNWYCAVVPKGVPKEIVQKLQAAFRGGMQEKAFVEHMDKAMMPIRYLSPEETLKIWKADYEIMGAMVRELGLKK